QGGANDTDGDGIKDGLEEIEGWDKNDANNPVQDGNQDSDGDGLKNGLEEVEGWDDNDANNPTDGGDQDSDGDGIKNGREELEGWDDNDANNPVENGHNDSDGDGFPAGQEWLEGWDDNDANNPVSSENVQSVELVLSNSVVKPGLELQASIDYQVQGYSDTFTTLDVPDADHVSWGIVDANGDSVVGLTPTSEGHLTIPESAEVMDYVDEPLTMQATFTEEGWFKHQTPQEKTFTVTLAEVSSSEVALLKDGVPLEGSEINIGDSIQAQTTVTLADGSEILAPSDASTGTWSIDQAAMDLGVTIDPVTGELDASGVDNAAVGEGGVSISISWTGAGSLEGGEGSITVRLEGYAFEVTKISDTLSIGPLVTVSMAESLGNGHEIGYTAIGDYAYYTWDDAEAYCAATSGWLMGEDELYMLSDWMSDYPERSESYRRGHGYIRTTGNIAHPEAWYIWGDRGSDGDRWSLRSYIGGGEVFIRGVVSTVSGMTLACAYAG
ncbi:hypothetical protein ACP43V_12285, partial [Vibrio genomosp. F10 str. 9ZC157]|uniref:hypothetical protein n=1 Tax=Vibrio genomosp. F10 TaxID=723171 RepID=UPI001F518D63